MAIEITTLHDTDEWNDLVEQSTQTTPFHRAESLAVMATHANATLHPYAGYKGHEPVGLFPIFEISKGPVSTAFSPPPNLKISYLGPALLNHTKQKQRRQEKTNSRFVSGCLETLAETVAPKYTHLRTSIQYSDTRPLIWDGFESTTRYTYVVDLTPSEDDLMMAFSSDARSNITGADQTGCEISRGGDSEIRRTIDELKKYHADQNVSYDISPEFVIDLADRLPDDRFRIYCCRVDGEFVGGHITLEQGDTIYGWQSWGDRETDVPVNDLLDWEIMRSARNRGLTQYDLVGANNERISKYKAKFNPQLRTYQTMETGTPAMSLVSELYKRVK